MVIDNVKTLNKTKNTNVFSSNYIFTEKNTWYLTRPNTFTKGKCNVLTCYGLCKGLFLDIKQTL